MGEPGYVTLSKGVGYTYWFLFLVVVVLAIVLPIVTKKKDTKYTDEVRPYYHDPFVASRDPFTVWGTSEKARQAYEKLDVKGKLGQMSLWDPGLLTGPANHEDYSKFPAEGGAGTYINIIRYESDPDNDLVGLKEYQDMALDADQIPILFAFDTIHGYSTVFPINLALSCTWDKDLIEEASAFAAKEMAAEGVVANFAPMVDVSRDPRWGRILESSGEDPYLNGLFGAATVRGFQKNGVAACVKHIAGYGYPEAGLDYNNARISPLELHNEFLRPYRYALMSESLAAEPNEQAWMGMASYHSVGGIPAHADPWLLNDIVRGRWNWDGLMVADYAGVAQLQAQRYVPSDYQSAVTAAITAGVNQNMADGYYWNIMQTVPTYVDDVENLYFRNRTVAEFIDLSAKRVIALKDKLGLFEKPYPEAPPKDVHYSKEALDAAQVAAEKSAVLLKNEGNALPLDASANKKYLVVGRMADSVRDVLGSWTGVHSKEGYDQPVLAEHTTTYLKGLQDKLGESADITYTMGYEFAYDFTDVGHCAPDQGNCRARNEQALNELGSMLDDADQAYDVIIAVVGEPGTHQGEATSKTNLNLAGNQLDVVEKLAEYRDSHPGTKLILVYNAGRPLTILYESLVADAILYMWSPGMRAGEALANLLFGDVWPSGHTTVTFPRNVGQVPIHYARHPSGRPPMRFPPEAPTQMTDGIPQPNFTSDYIDHYPIPLYYFGYGLSYTSFTIENRALSIVDAYAADSEASFTVTATVTSGAHSQPVDDVVQVYLRHTVSKQTHPELKLVGFQKVHFPVGTNTAQVSIPISIREHFGFYDSHLEYIVEKGDYYLDVMHHAGESVDHLTVRIV